MQQQCMEDSDAIPDGYIRLGQYERCQRQRRSAEGIGAEGSAQHRGALEQEPTFMLETMFRLTCCSESPGSAENYVSIDERPEGTYLIFKDAAMQEPQYELLVTPDGMDPNWLFKPSAWYSSQRDQQMIQDLEGINLEPDDDIEATKEMYGAGPSVYSAFIRIADVSAEEEVSPINQEHGGEPENLDNELALRSAPPSLVSPDSPWAIREALDGIHRRASAIRPHPFHPCCTWSNNCRLRPIVEFDSPISPSPMSPTVAMFGNPAAQYVLRIRIPLR